MISLKDSVDLLSSFWRWWLKRRNPVHLQARRLLETFDAHGVSCTGINALLPPTLRLNAICWSSPEHLVPVLTQDHIEWTAGFFALDSKWLAGRSDAAHQVIDSYKSPQQLSAWFEVRAPHHYDRFKLYLITSSPAAYDQYTKGSYALVLEEFFEVDDDTFSRYYFLTNGAGFDHPPCVLHLMQVLAIAHHHKVIVRRALLADKDLWPVANGEGFIPTALNKNRGTPLEADHEFWQHFSGESPWLCDLRTACDASLLDAGLHSVAESVQRDRVRFKRSSSANQHEVGPLLSKAGNKI
ncbi:MAG: hypothetical protein JKY26_08310 [Pseudomonas sp.]|nr:hypothetical protein [Pseudomonas sp.]